MSTKRTVIQALVRLEGHQDFEEVLGHLRGLRDAAIERMAGTAEPVLIGRAQGEYQVLDDLLKLASGARETLRNLG